MADKAFIDIAVLDGVRSALLAGKATIVFDRTLGEVAWANGQAARLFGYSSIGELTEQGIASFVTSRRQILGAFERGGDGHDVMVRIRTGMSTQLLRAHVAPLVLDDETLILAHFDDPAAKKEPSLSDVLAGLDAENAASAIIDRDGTVLAHDKAFDALGVAPETLRKLADEVADEDDRLVKRRSRAGESATPAAFGVGRLSEDPWRIFVLAMETEAHIEPPMRAAPASIVPEEALGRDSVSTDSASNAVPDHAPRDMREEHDRATAEPAPDEVAASEEAPFVYQPQSAPIRFVWKMDENNIFREVSAEFVKAVGSRSADILGRDFEQVAKRLKLDPDGEILNSLQRRDTWSGKSVFWPIENTDLRVPVDLAALPYYSRDRVFEGYRGFGVVRLPDAVIDPDGLGYSFGGDQLAIGDTLPDTELSDDAMPGEALDDPFQGEVPVLRSAALPREPRVGKQPDYAPHLAPSERAAFAEIGAQLRGLDKPEETDLENEADDDGDGDDAGLYDYRVDPSDQNIQLASDDDEAADADSLFDDAMLPPRSTSIRLVEANDDFDDASPIDNDADDGNSTDVETAQGGLTPDILDGLPLALLVVRNEQALFGNASFQIMTGYDDIETLNERGGLDALVLGPSVNYLPDETDGTLKRPMTLLAADGDRFAARAHMQIIPWQGASAIMFAFEPVNEAPEQNTPYIDDELGLFSEDDAVEQPAPDNLVQLPMAITPGAQANVESALQQHIAELESILDIASDAVVILKKDGTIRSINGPGEALFGYDKAKLEGKSFAYLFAHESQRTSMDYLRGMTGTAISSVLNEGREVLGREQNGGFIPLFMTMGTLPATDAICAVLRDITPWKQTEQALKEAKRQAEQASSSKSEFLAKISHEIRTPLNAIIGFSDLIAEERFGALNNQRYKDYLTDINKSGRHVLELVNDLLDISKIESGNQELSFEAVDLNAAVDDAMVMVQPQAARERIIMRSSYDPKLPGVVADVRSVRQIVLNLLSNSVRFTHTGGLVVVSTAYNPDSGVVLRVKDTGIGMTAKEIETALMPFQQVADRSAKNNQGTGLGLPLTKALVEANRAEFSIHSEPGRGTIVEILFPQSRVLVS